MANLPTDRPRATRCKAFIRDEDVPRGVTQCVADDGHDGPHYNQSVERVIEWEVHVKYLNTTFTKEP